MVEIMQKIMPVLKYIYIGIMIAIGIIIINATIKELSKDLSKKKID